MATAPKFRIDIDVHDLLTHSAAGPVAAPAGKGMKLPDPVFPRFPEKLLDPGPNVIPEKRDWTLPQVYRKMRGWLFPYIQRAVAAFRRRGPFGRRWSRGLQFCLGHLG